MRTRPIGQLSALLAAVALMACQGSEVPAQQEQQDSPPTLGPVDGLDLPPTDLERVAVGTAAPDFNLATYEGGPTSLSEHRGKNVILVFYRGHW